MILVDSSAWIEYYRKEGSIVYKDRITDAIKSNSVATNGIIQVEIVTFAKTEIEYRALVSDFSGFHWLELDTAIFNKASEIGFKLRQLGVTIPATDLLISACAFVNDSELIHLDRHFEQISQHFPINTIYIS